MLTPVVHEVRAKQARDLQNAQQTVRVMQAKFAQTVVDTRRPAGLRYVA